MLPLLHHGTTERQTQLFRMRLCTTYLPASVDFPASLAMPFNSSTDMVPSIWLPSGRPMAAMASVISTAPSEWEYGVCWRDTHTHIYTQHVEYQVLNLSILLFVLTQKWKSGEKLIGKAWERGQLAIFYVVGIKYCHLLGNTFAKCVSNCVFIFMFLLWRFYSWFTGKKCKWRQSI